MNARIAAKAQDIIARQRSAIVSGEYPDPEAIERIGPLLRRLTERELAPISEGLRRNLELLAIARDAVAEMREPAHAPAFRTYTPDGRMRAKGAEPSTLLKR